MHESSASCVGADAFVRPAEAKHGVSAEFLCKGIASPHAAALCASRTTPEECLKGYTSPFRDDEGLDLRMIFS